MPNPSYSSIYLLQVAAPLTFRAFAPVGFEVISTLPKIYNYLCIQTEIYPDILVYGVINQTFALKLYSVIFYVQSLYISECLSV